MSLECVFGFLAGSGLQECGHVFQKQKQYSRYGKLGDFEVSNSIQPLSFTVPGGSGADGLPYNPLRRQCQRERRPAEGERQPLRERQRLEWQVSPSCGGPATYCFSCLSGGSFLFQTPPPSAQHAADFIQRFRDCSITLRGDAFVFPSK